MYLCKCICGHGPQHVDSVRPSRSTKCGVYLHALEQVVLVCVCVGLQIACIPIPVFILWSPTAVACAQNAEPVGSLTWRSGCVVLSLVPLTKNRMLRLSLSDILGVKTC